VKPTLAAPIIFLAVGLLAAQTISAQTTGRIEGRVRDPDGTPLPGADVTAAGVSMQGTRSEVTLTDGSFRLLSLPPGLYTVGARLEGFNPANFEDIRISLGRTVVLEIVISPAIWEEMTVTGEVPSLDAAGTTTGASIPEEVFNELPTSRSFEGLSFLVASVTDGGLGLNPSIRGASAAENRYIVDGLDITDPAFGILSSSLNFEFVNELEVKTGGYSAEYGGALGGVLNVLTKSGSNDFHGSVFAYYNDDDLQASSPPTLEYGQWQGLTKYDFGFDLGGKLIDDRLWYFVAANPSVVEESFTTRQAIPFTTKTERLYYAMNLTWSISPSHSLVASVFGDPTQVSDVPDFDRFVLASGLNAAGRLLHDVDSGANNFNVRYESVPGGSLFLEASIGRHDQSGSFKAIDSSEPTYVDYAGGVWARQQGCGDPSLLTGNGISFVPGCVGGTWMWESGDRSRDQLRATLSWLKGSHELKAGAEVRNVVFRDEFHLTGPHTGPLVDALGSVVDPDGMRGGTFELYDTDYALWDWDQNLTGEADELALFLLDRWRATPYLTLNLGIRFDSYKAEGPGVRVDPNRSLDFGLGDMIAPRIGFAWDVTRDGRSKLFGHLGRYFESVPIDLTSRSFAAESWAMVHFFLYPLDGSLPTYDNPGFHLFSMDFSTIAPADPDLEPQHTDEAILGFEYEVRPSWVVGATAVYRELKDVFQLIALDPFLEFGLVMTNQGGTIDAHPISGDPLREPVFFAKPTREYRALELTLNRRLRQNWQLYGSYVLSKNEGNFGGLFSQELDALVPHATGEIAFPGSYVGSYGLMPNDRRHQVKLFGSRLWSFGLTTGFYAQYLSGTPIDKLGPHALVGPRFVAPRGSAGRTPDIWRLDLRLGYSLGLGSGLELGLVADIFNLTNQQRATAVDETWTWLPLFETVDPNECGGPGTGPGTECPWGNPNWGSPVAFQLPRTLRLGAKLSW
jgi:outer membrane receptor protein involved in Fe transport